MVQSLSHTTHYFEGGYQGDIGYTSHQEKAYWIDMSSNGVNGTYNTYVGLDRIMNNTDDTTPNSWYDSTAYPVPWPTAEYCFKNRAEAGGVSTSDYYHWGPQTKAYCISTATTPPPGTCGTYKVVTTTDRNSNVYIRVYNFSGATITNVVVTRTDNSTICPLGNISNNGSKTCSYSVSGSGTVRIYYNGTWGYCDSIQYSG